VEQLCDAQDSGKLQGSTVKHLARIRRAWAERCCRTFAPPSRCILLQLHHHIRSNVFILLSFKLTPQAR